MQGVVLSLGVALDTLLLVLNSQQQGDDREGQLAKQQGVDDDPPGDGLDCGEDQLTILLRELGHAIHPSEDSGNAVADTLVDRSDRTEETTEQQTREEDPWVILDLCAAQVGLGKTEPTHDVWTKFCPHDGLA